MCVRSVFYDVENTAETDLVEKPKLIVCHPLPPPFPPPPVGKMAIPKK